MRSALPSHVDEADLISYGLVGLIGAVERFDPARRVKFETYAVTRIKGAIIDELRALDWVPRSVRARARAIERKSVELESRLHRAPTDEELAAALGMKLGEFQDALTQISNGSIVALDEMWSVSPGGEPVSLMDTLGDARADDPADAARRQRSARHARRRDRAAARARAHRGGALLLRQPQPEGDRRDPGA